MEAWLWQSMSPGSNVSPVTSIVRTLFASRIAEGRAVDGHGGQRARRTATRYRERPPGSLAT